MSLSCTISQILSIIFQNLKRSRDHDHAHLRDYLSIWRPILHMANQCTKFEVSSLSHSRDILGELKIKKMGHVTWPRILQGQFIVRKVGLDMMNLHTKCDVSMFTHYEDMKGNANSGNLDGLRRGLRVIQGHRQNQHWIEHIQLPFLL